MSRKFKTSKKKRTNYIYYGEDGSKTILISGEGGVTEAIIKVLHELDDDEVDNNRRETRRHGSIDGTDAKYLKDIYTDVEDEVISNIERESNKIAIHGALKKLKPGQRDLIKALYLSDTPMTQAEYAEKLGIRESSVSQKAWRARRKIEKLLQDIF